MTFLSTRRHRIAAAVAAATIALGGGSAAVIAATTPASAGTVPVAAVTKPAGNHAGAVRHHHRRNLLAHSDHATIELDVKGHWVTYQLDRGKVTSVSPTAISLGRPDGQSITLTITSATKFGHKVAASAVKTGAEATVVSENGTARRVVVDLHLRPTTTPSTAPAAAPAA